MPGVDAYTSRSLPRITYMALTILCERIIIRKLGPKTVGEKELRECLSDGRHLWLNQLPSMKDVTFAKKKFIVLGLRKKYQQWEPSEYKRWIRWKNECIKLAESI